MDDLRNEDRPGIVERERKERAAEMMYDALLKGIRWRLDGQPCWCECERRVAWKKGTKLHTSFCVAATEAIALARGEM
jgi:hypothetical protein